MREEKIQKKQNNQGLGSDTFNAEVKEIVGNVLGQTSFWQSQYFGLFKNVPNNIQKMTDVFNNHVQEDDADNAVLLKQLSAIADKAYDLKYFLRQSPTCRAEPTNAFYGIVRRYGHQDSEDEESKYLKELSKFEKKISPKY